MYIYFNIDIHIYLKDINKHRGMMHTNIRNFGGKYRDKKERKKLVKRHGAAQRKRNATN